MHSQDAAEKAVRMNLAQTHAKMASMTSMAVFVSCAKAQAHAGNNFRMAALGELVVVRSGIRVRPDRLDCVSASQLCRLLPSEPETSEPVWPSGKALGW